MDTSGKQTSFSLSFDSLISSKQVSTPGIYLVTAFGLICFGCSEKKLYQPVGKDTVESFGNGRFELTRSHNIETQERFVDLWDNKQMAPLLREVFHWNQDGDWVYLYGIRTNKSVSIMKNNERVEHPRELSYVILHIRTEFYEYYDRIEKAPPHAREHLKKLWTRQ